jgi:flagellar basal-body rod modification protein FlgD
METTSTPSVAGSVNTAGSKAGLGGISGEDFMNILVKQLQMQDPMKPMTNQEMVSQLSTIRELEMNTRLSGKLEQLTDQQRFGSAAALIGKHVKGKVSDAEGNEFPMEGVVTGIRFTAKGEVMLELDTGETLPLIALEQVTNPDGTTVGTGSSA